MALIKNFNGLRLALNETIGECAVEYHDVLPSTQIRAKELAAGGAARAVVAAGEQTAGRGRMARRWESPKGSGLYFSVLFRPVLPAESVHMVNIAAALSVAGAVKSALDIGLQLKWPNDLLMPSAAEGGKARKICGILSESAMRDGRLDYCVTGIGLNLYAPSYIPEDLKDRAGWLSESKKESGEEIDAEKLLVLTAGNFFQWIGAMEREGTGHILAEYRKNCASVGQVVNVDTGVETFTGRCSGIGDRGELLLKTPDGIMGFHAADVTHATLEAT